MTEKKIEEKGKTQKLKIIVRATLRTLLVILIIAGVGLSVYFLKPLKQTVFLYPFETKGTTQLSCETVAGASLFPQMKLDKEKDGKLDKLEIALHTKGSNIAIEIGDKTIKFLTSTSVEGGLMEPAVFTILSNDTKSLVATIYEDSVGITNSKIIDSFILNKESGYAIWTKSKDISFFSKNPDTQVYYLRCI